jgi:hypothetical protein
MSEQQRRVVAWVTISMDGYTSGPQGPAHDTWMYEHVKRETLGGALRRDLARRVHGRGGTNQL